MTLIFMRFSSGRFIVRQSVFIYSGFVHRIQPGTIQHEFMSKPYAFKHSISMLDERRGSSPSLIKVNKENNIISKASQPMRSWHGNDKSKDIVDERIKSLLKNKQ